MREDLDAEQRATAIAQYLTERLYDASVQYDCSAGDYEFVVRYWDSTFTFWFPKEGLLRKSVEELERMVSQIVGRIRTNPTAPSVDKPPVAIGEYSGGCAPSLPWVAKMRSVRSPSSHPSHTERRLGSRPSGVAFFVVDLLFASQLDGPIAGSI